MEMPVITFIFLTLAFIIFKIKQIEMTQEELAQGLENVTAIVGKVKDEVTTTLAKVTELETALANSGSVSPEVQAAFEGLKASVIAVDELTPDILV
jgi:uncharacterized protein YoxC